MHPNVELVLDTYLAYSKGYLEDVVAGFDRDIEIVDKPHKPLRGLSRSRALVRKLRMLSAATLDPESCETQGDDVVVRGRYRGRRAGTMRRFDVPVTHVWTFREGRARRIAVYTTALE
jgi:ketosteroid isomerase-like protein